METRPRAVLDSPEARSQIACPHFGPCGGCAHQDQAYSDQLQRKESFVRTSLSKLSVRNFHPILPSPDLFYYRNKMEFSFGDQKDLEILNRAGYPASLPPLSLNVRSAEYPAPVHIGLHPKGRFSLTTPTPECKLISEDANRITQTVARWATEFSIPIYVRPKNKGVLRHLVIREGKNTGERLVTLVATSAVTHIEELGARLKALHSISTFVVARHDGLSDIARGSEYEALWGEGWIREKVDKVEFRVSPHSFMQTNTRAAEVMIQVLRNWAGYGGTLLDLYGGVGTIGLNLSDQFMEVVGIECETESVANARETAKRNGIINARFEEGRVEKLVDKFPEDRRSTTCIVDPSRAGLHPDAAKALSDSNFPTILYVSCNPLSLARDLSILASKYTIDCVQPIDFFPHTDHVETIVRLQLHA